MRMLRILSAVSLATLLLGCPDIEPGSQDVAADSGTDTVVVDTGGDTGGDTAADIGVDAGPGDELWAGAAFRSFLFPIGIPTVGLAPNQGPVTRFNEIYAGTNAQHTDVGAKAVVLRAGGKAIVLVRLDLIGLWDTNRDEVGAELRKRGRGDLADGVILSATHTHASGGRLMDHPIIRIAVDTFVPGVYKRVRDSIVQAILAADEAAVRAEFGWTTILVPTLHKDRRCENPDIKDDTMGLIKVVAADDKRILAVVVNYSMHGTILGNDQHTLSGDAPGAVEIGIEQRLPAGAQVLFIQSWGGDMAPVTPTEYATQQGFDLRPDFVSLASIAAAAGDIVVPALDGITTSTDPEIRVENIRFEMDPLEINADGSFDNYPYGGIYCMPSASNCPDEGGMPYTALSCFPFKEEETITSSQIAAARIGDLGMVTLPGEPVTPLGLELRDRALLATGLTQVLVLGYSQGYLGYLLHPDDYWMGGYEGSGALMGPGGGQFLVDRGVAIAERMMNPASTLPFEVVNFRWEDDVGDVFYEPLQIEEALGTAAFTIQPSVTDGIAEASWNGGDPAADHPTVTLEKDQGDGTFAAVTRTNGSILTNWGHEMEIYLDVEPRYSKQKFGPRTFTWTVKIPTSFSVPLAWGELQGTYRFTVAGKRPTEYSLTSDPFVVP